MQKAHYSSEPKTVSCHYYRNVQINYIYYGKKQAYSTYQKYDHFDCTYYDKKLIDPIYSYSDPVFCIYLRYDRVF